jgi:hypothetical protein
MRVILSSFTHPGPDLIPRVATVGHEFEHLRIPAVGAKSLGSRLPNVSDHIVLVDHTVPNVLR